MAIQGTVLRATGPWVFADGLAELGAFSLVSIGGLPALATALRPGYVELALLAEGSVSAGDTVEAKGAWRLPAGRKLLGRLVDPLGMPLDGGACAARPLEQLTGLVATPPSRVLDAPDPLGRFDLGFLGVDLFGRLRRGTSVLLNCPIPMSERTRVLDFITRYQCRRGAVVVTAGAGFGESGRHFPRERTIRVEAGVAPYPIARWMVPWAALALARSLALEGEDVVVCFESLEGIVRAVGEVPMFRAAPSEVGQISSQAGRWGKGIITLLCFAAGMPRSDVREQFDSEIDLWSALEGRFDHRHSLLCRPPLRVRPMAELGRIVGSVMEAELLQLDSEAQIQGLAARTVAGLRYRDSLSDCPLVQQLSLLAIASLPELPPERVAQFAEKFEAYLRDREASLLEAIAGHGLIEISSNAPWLEIARRLAQE